MRSKLREHERVVFKTRKHWLTVAVPALIFLAAIAFLVFAYWIAAPGLSLGTIRKISLAVFVAAGLFFGYREWFRRRDIWAVTNLRVIDEKGIFTLFTKESPLEKINNISYKQNILGRILRYGQIEIQTAAEDGAMIYQMITNPKLLKDTIAHERDEYNKALQGPKGTFVSQA